jgi:adenine C2-methylase RlmN of 23S rRNA A2503 and tRNA A37
VNDSPEQARQLATPLEKRRMHLNLLTDNPTGPGLSGVAYEPPPRETVGVFLDELHARGIVAHFAAPVAPPSTGRAGS